MRLVITILSCFCCSPRFGIFDEQRRLMGEVRGPCCPCQTVCCTSDVDFPVSTAPARYSCRCLVLALLSNCFFFVLSVSVCLSVCLSICLSFSFSLPPCSVMFLPLCSVMSLPLCSVMPLSLRSAMRLPLCSVPLVFSNASL